jgi:hypothetical protein
MCAIVSIANMQYGIDTAAVGGLQAMPGFLKVFGFKDPTSPFGYGIDVSSLRINTEACADQTPVYSTTTNDFVNESR